MFGTQRCFAWYKHCLSDKVSHLHQKNYNGVFDELKNKCCTAVCNLNETKQSWYLYKRGTIYYYMRSQYRSLRLTYFRF